MDPHAQTTTRSKRGKGTDIIESGYRYIQRKRAPQEVGHLIDDLGKAGGGYLGCQSGADKVARHLQTFFRHQLVLDTLHAARRPRKLALVSVHVSVCNHVEGHALSVHAKKEVLQDTG